MDRVNGPKPLKLVLAACETLGRRFSPIKAEHGVALPIPGVLMDCERGVASITDK